MTTMTSRSIQIAAFIIPAFLLVSILCATLSRGGHVDALTSGFPDALTSGFPRQEPTESDVQSDEAQSESARPDTAQDDARDQQESVPEHNHPDWFDQGSYIKDGIEHVAIQTEPQSNPVDARKAIGRAALGVIRTRAELWTGNHDAAIMENLEIDADYLMTNLVEKNRIQVLPYSSFVSNGSNGPDLGLYCGYTQLALGPEFKQFVHERSKKYQTRKRLYTIAAVGLGMLGLLTVAFANLRLNHATRGFYSRRIMLGAVVAAVVVVLFCISLINHV